MEAQWSTDVLLMQQEMEEIRRQKIQIAEQRETERREIIQRQISSERRQQ